MTDIVAGLATAIGLATKLRAVAEKVKDAELKGILADLSLELSDMKLKVVDLMNENMQLRQKIQEQTTPSGPPCPKCHKRGWQLTASRPDPTFGALGGKLRTYKCPSCDFTDEVLETPS